MIVIFVGDASHRYRGSGHRKHQTIDTNNISSLLDNLLHGYDQQLRPSHGGERTNLLPPWHVCSTSSPIPPSRSLFPSCLFSFSLVPPPRLVLLSCLFYLLSTPIVVCCSLHVCFTYRLFFLCIPQRLLLPHACFIPLLNIQFFSLCFPSSSCECFYFICNILQAF